MVKIEGSMDEIRELLGNTKRTRRSPKLSTKKPAKVVKRKGKAMTRKTQLAINRGRKAKGMKPISWKKKGR